MLRNDVKPTKHSQKFCGLLDTRHGFTPIKEFTDGPLNGQYLTKSIIEKLLLQIPCALQVFSGIKLMPVGFGESYAGIWQLSA
jgi:hypothetical protein